MKKLLSALLAAGLAATLLLVGCTNNNSNDKESGDSSNNSGIFDPTDDRLSADDGIEAVSFKGQQYKIGALEILAFEVFGEDTSDVVDEAVYNRNLRVEDKYDIEFVPVITTGYASGGGKVHVDAVQKSIDAGDGAFDMTLMSANRVGTLITGGYFYDWNSDIPGINLEQPWWNQRCNETFTVNDMLFGAVGDVSLSGITQTFAYLFNANMAEDLQIEDLYQVVRDGKWTTDYVNALVKDVYSDLNKDDARDKEDEYGFATGVVQNLDAYLPSYGIHLIGSDSDGELAVIVDNNRDQLQGALEKVSSLFYDNTGSYVSMTAAEYADRYTMFAEGRVLLSDMHLNCIENYLRGMTDLFGVLPYPKFDEAQKNYYSSSLNNFTVLCMPYNVENLEMVGKVTETLCCETYRTVITAYYDTALKDKYTDAQDDEEMLDLIMAGRNYDLAMLFVTNLDGLDTFFRKEVASQSDNVAGSLDAQFYTWTAALTKLQENFVDMEIGA